MNHDTGFIYALADAREPDVFCYIGQTINLSSRIRRHMRDAERGSELPVHRWIRKLPQPPWVKIQWMGLQREMNEKEAWYIAAYRSNDQHRLLNLTDGGDGKVGFEHSIESKLKMSRAKKGKKRAGGNNRTGFKLSEETKRKISEARLGVQNHGPDCGCNFCDKVVGGKARWA